MGKYDDAEGQTFDRAMKSMEPLNKAEEAAVEALGDKIGYGRLMQLAEQIWHRKAIEDGTPGGEHTHGPCAAFMVKCPCLSDDFAEWRDNNGTGAAARGA